MRTTRFDRLIPMVFALLLASALILSAQPNEGEDLEWFPEVETMYDVLDQRNDIGIWTGHIISSDDGTLLALECTPEGYGEPFVCLFRSETGKTILEAKFVGFDTWDDHEYHFDFSDASERGIDAMLDEYRRLKQVDSLRAGSEQVTVTLSRIK